MRLLHCDNADARRLRIAVLAPPWITVPPSGYYGIEAVVELLCEALVARGHDVAPSAARGSRSPVRVHPLLEQSHPGAIGSSLHESDHVACAWEQIELAADRGCAFDLVHDHSGFTALAMADRVNVSVVHTIDGAVDRDTSRVYQRHGGKARLRDQPLAGRQRACRRADRRRRAQSHHGVHAVEQVGSIDPLRCRSSVAERYDISVTASSYERVYRHASEPEPAPTTPAAAALANADRLSQRRSGRR
ncbi:MAG: glycosyltransferase [Solirubrobacteraceae bacterium]